MEYTNLADGNVMPMLGFGVFQIDDATTQRCVVDALASGYRMIDTAQAYGNEHGVGAALAESGVDRDDVFVVDKVWITDYGAGTTLDSVKRSVEALGTGHIDLMLLHQAYNDYHAAWRDLEKAKEEGLVRSIGVSNFDPVRLADLCVFADEKPVVNQVETHVFWQQTEAHANMERLGIQHMSWGPFAEGANNFFKNPLLAEIGEAHGKSTGQVALRYLIDRGVVVIPKSQHRERMAENIDVFDFELTDEERDRIAGLDGGKSLIWDHGNVEFIAPWLESVKKSMEK